MYEKRMPHEFVKKLYPLDEWTELIRLTYRAQC